MNECSLAHLPPPTWAMRTHRLQVIPQLQRSFEQDYSIFFDLLNKFSF